MILCLGATPTVQRTLTFDNLSLDAVNRATNVVESSSGKSINVARTLRTLGCDVLAMGFLGGESGEFVRRDLSSLGIRHQFVEVAPRTRICTTVIDRRNGTVTELVEESAPVEVTAYGKLYEVLVSELKAVSVLVLSGSLTPGAPQDFYARCTRAAKDAKVQVVIDGRGEPLRLALAERPDIVKPNRHELQETAGTVIDSDAKLRESLKSLVAGGPRWAVITNGSRDLMAYDGEILWRITPPAIEAVNPIGSGDALAAGLALALSEGKEIAAACRLGAACGAANAMNSPAGHARLADIEAMVPGVIVSAWDN